MRARLPGALIVAAVSLLGCDASAPAAEGSRDAAERDALQAELELTRQEAPYLVLHMADARLTMMMRGSPLRNYPVLDWHMRTPRVGFLGFGRTPRLEPGAWAGGLVSPAARRIVREILPPDAESEEADDKPSALPPLPEELVPAPSVYTIRFETEFALEVLAGAGEGLGVSWNDRVDVFTGRSLPGLSLTLSPEDAGSLYRSLEGEVALVIR